MKHEFVKATWKTKNALEKIIQSRQEEGWSVVALGDLFGGDVLVLCRDGHRYEHDIVSVSFRTIEHVSKFAEEREADGWFVCAIGECFGSVLMILKRRSI